MIACSQSFTCVEKAGQTITQCLPSNLKEVCDIFRDKDPKMVKAGCQTSDCWNVLGKLVKCLEDEVCEAKPTDTGGMSWVLICGIVVLVIALGVGGYFGFRYYQKRKNESQENLIAS